MFKLTSQHHSAKNSVVPVQRAAVPAVVSELVLALFDPLFGSLADGLHQVRVPLAQLPLLVHETRNVVAYHPSPQSADVPANTDPSDKGSFHRQNCVVLDCPLCYSRNIVYILVL